MLTGADLLPSAAADGEGAALLDADPEAPSADEQTPAAAAGEIESLYSAEGKHTKQTGYYVKPVGNAPVAKPQALSAEQVVAAQASPAGAISGARLGMECIVHVRDPRHNQLGQGTAAGAQRSVRCHPDAHR